MKTAAVMAKDNKVVCVETYDTETQVCDVMTCNSATVWATDGPVYVWGNGEFLENSIDLKKKFHERHNFFISFRAFAPFKSIKPAVQLAQVLEGALKNGRVFWRTRAGNEKAWWDNTFSRISSGSN